jgi:hypothetical protein
MVILFMQSHPFPRKAGYFFFILPASPPFPQVPEQQKNIQIGIAELVEILYNGITQRPCVIRVRQSRLGRVKCS